METEEHFKLDYEFTTHGSIKIKKFQSIHSPMKAYFADVDSQVINGYFCFGKFPIHLAIIMHACGQIQNS